MRLIAVACAALVVTGCATTQAVDGSAPVEVISSAKSPADVAFCLARRWSTPVLDAPSGAKVVDVKGTFDVPLLSYTIAAEGTGSRVEVRRGNTLFGAKRSRNCF